MISETETSCTLVPIVVDAFRFLNTRVRKLSKTFCYNPRQPVTSI